MDFNDFIKLCNSYNISSNGYGPTIYQNKKDIGLCIDIKDSIFGFLTRIFTFNSLKEAEDFLKKYNWYQTNSKKYPVTLSLDNYETTSPTIIYKYKNNVLDFSDMLNLNESIKDIKTKEINTNLKNIYIANINSLTNYINELNSEKRRNVELKNALKVEENNLKFELLKELTAYYGRNKSPVKKEITTSSYEEVVNKSTNLDINKLEENYLKKQLEDLILEAKTLELDEKNLITIYSNKVYEYNISILKKQIEFVKNKIIAEKNFSLKGSKIHNIDKELKSFLDSSTPPVKIEVFIKEQSEKIKEKYSCITDILDASKIISGNPLNIVSEEAIEENINNNIFECLKDKYDALEPKAKSSLILYHSFFKNICNYIFDNHYPSIEKIKKQFDITNIYQEFKEIVYHPNNNHYLLKYFFIIDFDNIDSFLASIINLCKTIDNTKITINEQFEVFSLNTSTTYKAFSNILSSSDKNANYLITVPKNYAILFVPEKIELDEDTKEMQLVNSTYLYIKGIIIESNEMIILNKYSPEKEINKKDKRTYIKNIKLLKSIKYDLGYIEGEDYDKR